MLFKTLASVLLLPTALRAVLAQNSTSTTACNNSPALCDQPYNNITHLGAHNSPFVRNDSNGYSISGNQYFNTGTQLSAGVRLLTAQVQTNDDSGELHVCHTSCELLDAGRLSSWLSEVNSWLNANPNEVVTVLLVNGAGASASDLAAEYQVAGISDVAYTPSSDTATSDWPTLQSLINNGTRMINFVSSGADSSAAPFLMAEFTYIFENSYNNTTPTSYSCEADRPDSVQGETSTALANGMMPFMNHFLYVQQAFGIESPNDTYVTTTNAPSGGVGNLGSAATQCTNEYGRPPTFILVDFFNVGPAIATVDRLNGVTDPVGRTTVSTSVQSADSGAGPGVAVRYAMLCLTILAGLSVLA